MIKGITGITILRKLTAHHHTWALPCPSPQLKVPVFLNKTISLLYEQGCLPLCVACLRVCLVYAMLRAPQGGKPPCSACPHGKVTACQSPPFQASSLKPQVPVFFTILISLFTIQISFSMFSSNVFESMGLIRYSSAPAAITVSLS